MSHTLSAGDLSIGAFFCGYRRQGTAALRQVVTQPDYANDWIEVMLSKLQLGWRRSDEQPRSLTSQKLHDFALGPAAIVRRMAVAFAAGLAKECAVAAVISLNVGDVRIRCNAAQSLGLHADEGIVLRMDDQGGPRDAVDHVGGGGLRRRIIGCRETGVVGGV